MGQKPGISVHVGLKIFPLEKERDPGKLPYTNGSPERSAMAGKKLLKSHANSIRTFNEL